MQTHNAPQVIDLDPVNGEVLAVETVEEAVAAEVSATQATHVAAALSNRKGMTLVEIMIVLTILAGIMVAVGVAAFDALDRANIKQTKVKLEKISAKVQEYYAFQSPAAMPENIKDLTNPPGGEPAYLKEGDIKDAWGQDITYSKTGNRDYELRSPGPDGSDGSADDITLDSGN